MLAVKGVAAVKHFLVIHGIYMCHQLCGVRNEPSTEPQGVNHIGFVWHGNAVNQSVIYQ